MEGGLTSLQANNWFGNTLKAFDRAINKMTIDSWCLMGLPYKFSMVLFLICEVGS